MFPFCVASNTLNKHQLCVAVSNNAKDIIKNDRWEGKTESTLTSATP